MPSFLGTGDALRMQQIALVVAPAFIVFGYNQSNVGGLLSLQDWTTHFPEIDTVHSTGAEKKTKSTLQGLVVATFTIGALIGALSTSWTGDRFGRRNVIFAAGIFTLIGEILECSAFHLAQLVVGRVLIGFGIGQHSTIVPVWLSETTGAKNRGRQVVLTGLFMSAGYMLQSWINLGFWELHNGPVTWRPPIAIPIALSLVLLVSIYFFPESPRWLLMKNRPSEARTALSNLRGHGEESYEVTAELQGIEHSLEETAKGGAVKVSDMFKMGEEKMFYRFMLCMMLQFFQQMSGTNLISVYSTILFQDNLGLGYETARILSGGTLTWKFLSSFMGFICIDRFGRRAVFLISGTGMSLCMVALAIATSFPKDNKSAQIAAAFFIFMFNTFVPIGFLGANFLYATEVAPMKLRMAMTSASLANHWLWNFLVVMVTPVALQTIGYQYYIIYAVIGACIPISVYLFFPETAGRNLEEIDLMFRQSPSVWGTVRFAKSRPIAMPQEFSEGKSGEDTDYVENKKEVA
ncbi:putative sugar transporter [Plectosphaerella plurivora]|uniref:Sugar transporter n=1 Tax=Plectosphaerella plurivora TaxID=936078 RepID=A0A9P8VKS6_9PEZI|nr:putative sugar transporter [Plectosphaerella plurivora]